MARTRPCAGVQRYQGKHDHEMVRASGVTPWLTRAIWRMVWPTIRRRPRSSRASTIRRDCSMLIRWPKPNHRKPLRWAVLSGVRHPRGPRPPAADHAGRRAGVDAPGAALRALPAQGRDRLGADADLAIVDRTGAGARPEELEYLDQAKWSPFQGMEVRSTRCTPCCAASVICSRGGPRSRSPATGGTYRSEPASA